ncbi:MAG: acyl-CoA dehydrogenase [Alphaproteobacteria bacterium]
MIDFVPPLRDMRFVLRELAGLDEIAAFPGFEDATPDLVDAVLEEAGRFAAQVIAPVNRPGDIEGSRLENGAVVTPPGFHDAYARFVEGGWGAVAFDPAHGGQGLPYVLSIATLEMWLAASQGFALCPLLTLGAVEAIATHGDDALKAVYLSKLVSGQWTGTMNLTEPQAGSDMGLLRTRAVPDGDRYRITGQKIFITYGDHDMAENIVHLVLARLPDAPRGVKGISLFAVPKFLPDADGAPGVANDLRCASIEHKLGIHASPTCVMEFGPGGEGAIGWLIGEENAGLACMFTMMNNARLAVGLHGPAIAERAYQQAVAYARERVQGVPVTGGAESVPIIRHPDVRRMLMQMKARTEAMRALAYFVAAEIDRARHHPDAERRRAHQATVDLLIPVVKGWCTDTGFAVASTGVQVHGGMGYIEETGAAQHLRDARIAMIYEGTNGIQAGDLIGRKVGRDGGDAARAFLGRMNSALDELAEAGEDLADIRAALADGLVALDAATAHIVDSLARGPLDAAAAAAPYLETFGRVAGGWLMARGAARAHAALAAGTGDTAFHETKIATARFFAEHELPGARANLDAIRAGAGTVMALAEDQF